MSNSEHKKASGCVRALRWVPVIFIASIIIWSYYAYVVQLCIIAIENTFEKIVFLIFYHIICALFVWSYWNTVFTPLGTVPSNWRLPTTEWDRLSATEYIGEIKESLENIAKGLPVKTRTSRDLVRFCDKCKIIKPDRARHCRVCGTCVLKMDHHCPWVNNCVNFMNYKYFVLFLGYGLLYCLYVALTSLEYFILFWRGELTSGRERCHILFLFFVSLMFAISLLSLFGYHIYLVLMNRTTLEAIHPPIFHKGKMDKNGFNLGKYANFQQVFGDNWKLWFLPVYTSIGDGIQYPSLEHRAGNSTSYHSMNNTINRNELHPTDKLISNVNVTTDALSPVKRNEEEEPDFVIDMSQNNSNNYSGDSGTTTPTVCIYNGHTVLNMDLLNANNSATNADRNSNIKDIEHNVAEHRED